MKKLVKEDKQETHLRYVRSDIILHSFSDQSFYIIGGTQFKIP